MENNMDNAFVSNDTPEEKRETKIETKDGITENMQEIFATEINDGISQRFYKVSGYMTNYDGGIEGDSSREKATKTLVGGISTVNFEPQVEIGIFTQDILRDSGCDYGTGIFFIKDGKYAGKNQLEIWRNKHVKVPALKTVENLSVSDDKLKLNFDKVYADGRKESDYLYLKAPSVD